MKFQVQVVILCSLICLLQCNKYLLPSRPSIYSISDTQKQMQDKRVMHMKAITQMFNLMHNDENIKVPTFMSKHKSNRRLKRRIVLQKDSLNQKPRNLKEIKRKYKSSTKKHRKLKHRLNSKHKKQFKRRNRKTRLNKRTQGIEHYKRHHKRFRNLKLIKRENKWPSIYNTTVKLNLAGSPPPNKLKDSEINKLYKPEYADPKVIVTRITLPSYSNSDDQKSKLL